MFTRVSTVLVIGFAAASVAAQEPAPPATPVTPPPPNSTSPAAKKEFADLSKIVEKMVVAKLPKSFTDNSNWGMTIPVTEKLPLPRLRTYLKSGDQMVVPHGLWRKAHVWIADPDRDVKLEIIDIKKHDDKAMRVTVDTTVNLQGEGELQHWQKGLGTIGLTATATSVVLVSMDVDVAVSLDTSKFPPELQVEPKVASSRVEIKDFQMFHPGQRILGNTGEQLNGDIKNLLQQLAKGMEPEIQKQANQAIASSLKDGKATISAATLFKGLGGTPPKAN